MSLTRRQTLAFFAAASVVPFVGHAATPEAVRLVVPFPAGGGGDVLARSVVDSFATNLGTKVWVSNNPGAGGSLGAQLAAKAPGDGSTVLYTTNGMWCVNQLLYPDLKFDPLAALAPVGRISRMGLILALNPNAIAGVTDLATLIDYARRNPGALNFASSGTGTTSHLAGLYFGERLGLNLAHIPYRGGAAAMLDVLAGRIPFMIDVAPNVLPQVESGKLKALGVTTLTRLKAAPNIPTFDELGIKGFDLSAWDGMAMPAETADAILDRNHDALELALADPSVVSRLAVKGAEPVPGTRKDFRDFIAAETPKWAALVERIKATKA